MDAERFRQAYERLELLDERLRHKVLPREHLTLGPMTQRQLEERVRDLGQYAVDLKEVVRELFLAIAGQPVAKETPAAEGAEETD